MKRELGILGLMTAVFLGCVFFPAEAVAERLGSSRLGMALAEMFALVRWYARAHVLLCLVPAFLIAGAISVFVGRTGILKYFGAGANKVLSYSVAAVSGTVLAVCSCTVLPLFAGIYRMGAGVGPATTFLYSGPAINVLAIILTARLLGVELGFARAVGAVVFSVVLGLLMHACFRRSESGRHAATPVLPAETPRPLHQTVLFILALVGILIFANWARSGDVRAVFLCCPNGLSTLQVEGHVVASTESRVRILDTQGAEHVIDRTLLSDLVDREPGSFQNLVHRLRWALVGLLLLGVAFILHRWYTEADIREWLGASWALAKQVLPLLLVGVAAAGLCLGRSGREALIPIAWINTAVGGNGPLANLFAAVLGAFMYFATLTEVPILQGLLGSGMGKGPALALLLAGPAVSLPSLLVIRSVMGTRRTLVFVLLVILLAALTGFLFGRLAA